MSAGNEKIIKVEIDKSVKSDNDLLIKMLKANKEFVSFVKNYNDADYNSLVKIMHQLKNIKTSKKTKMGLSKNKTLRKFALKGGIGREELTRYIRIGIYFIYCSLIAYGIYQGSDMIRIGLTQLSDGTCYSWTSRLTSALGTRHPFCDTWVNFTDVLLRALTGFEPGAIGTVAVGSATPLVAIYIQQRAINAMAGAIADRIVGAQEGRINYASGPILIPNTQVIELPPPTAAVLPPNIPTHARNIEPISSDDESPTDSRIHPSRRGNIRRSGTRRSTSSSPRRGGKRQRKTRRRYSRRRN
jgi:hypothetical protein